jgi:hypothetical protein
MSDLNYVNFVEPLIADSIALLFRDGEPCGTAFFISDKGELCSCYHLLGPSQETARFEALWHGKKYPLEYKPAMSSAAADLGIWAIQSGEVNGDISSVAGIWTGQIPAYRRSPAIAIGFPGLAARNVPVAMRVTPGIVDAVREYVVGDSSVERLEILDMAVAKGASGSPIFDLRLFRVVGYVQGEFGNRAANPAPFSKPETDKSAPVQRWGRACSILPLVRLRSDLVPLWTDVGAALDARKQVFFRGGLFPNAYVTLSDTQKAASESSIAEIGRLEKAGIYERDVYVSRAVSETINEFLCDDSKSIFILTGFSGTGKTNLLVTTYLQHGSSFDLAIFSTYRGLKSRPVSEALSHALRIEGSLLSLRQTLGQSIYRSTLVILDGFEDSPTPDAQSLSATLAEFSDLASDPGHLVKVILSIRKEWLRDAIPAMLEYSERPVQEHLNLSRVFFDGIETSNGITKYRPVIEVKLLAPASTTRSQEQSAIYDRHRQVLSEGPSAIVEYDALPPEIQRILDRPLIIKMFIGHYRNRPIPAAPVRSLFMREIVESQAARLRGAIGKRAANSLLEHLAFELFQTGVAALSDNILFVKPWFDYTILELLLKNTFYLSRNDLRSPIIDAYEVSFSSDWLGDYYLGLYIFETARQLKDLPAKQDFISSLFSLVATGAKSAALTTALSYVCEFCTLEQHETFTALWSVLSAPEPDMLLSDTVQGICEYIRVSYGFDPRNDPENRGAKFLERLRRTEVLSNDGWRRIIHFAENLGDQGTPDALTLLTVHPSTFQTLSAEVRAEWESVQALKLFKKHEIDEALQLIQSLDLESLPSHSKSRVYFTEGRCYQFRQEYSRAGRSFERGAAIADEYGSMCRHQLGFILFLRDSDFPAAAAVLEANRSNHASKLLLAQCLIETASYEEAEDVLSEELGWRGQWRRTLSYGKVKRVEAQLLFRLFQTEKAVSAASEAVECTRSSVHFLSYANVLETQGLILGLLVGDVSASLDLIGKSIDLAERGKHNPTRSWSLQSGVLVKLLAGREVDVAKELALVSTLQTNPNQERRNRLISLMATHARGTVVPDALIARYKNLQLDYERAGQAWYAGLIQLLIGKLDNRLAMILESIPTLFGKRVDQAGLKESYLIRRINSMP